MIGYYKKLLYLFLYQVTKIKRKKNGSLLVLTYHRVSEKPDFEDPLKVSKNSFEKQMIFLKKHYQIISGDFFKEIIINKKPFPSKSCLITFDDGWEDNHRRAFPILQKLQIPAIIFISTEYIGSNKIFWHEELKEVLLQIPSILSREKNDVPLSCPEIVFKMVNNILKLPPNMRIRMINELVILLKNVYPNSISNLNKELKISFYPKMDVPKSRMLSWEQVIEMSRRNVCFGSHTKSHAILTQINKEKIYRELIESKEYIEHKLDKEICFISYPNGNYNGFIIETAKKAGYLAGFTCDSGKNFKSTNFFKLRRKHVREDLTCDFNGKFSELFFKVELSGIRDDLKRFKKVEIY